MGTHRLSYHGGEGAWNRRRVFTCFRTTAVERAWYFKQVFTCFRTTVERVHGTGGKYLLAFVPRWRRGMVFLASIYRLSYHTAESYGILSKYLPAFVPRWSGCMEPETDFYLLSYHAATSYGIFSKYLPAFVPRRSGCMEPEASIYRLSYHGGGRAWYFKQVFTCFRTTTAVGYGIFCKYPSGLVPLYRQPGGTKGNTLRRKVPTSSPPPQNSGHQPADTQYIRQLVS